MHSTNRIEPKFFIITVTYNAGKVLEETLQSVANQTYRQVEYILVDGGSKDNTLSIAEKYRSHIHQLISEPDKGLYDAMN
jgi:glycosyltransferase involved in cell wall biosynthesis